MSILEHVELASRVRRLRIQLRLRSEIVEGKSTLARVMDLAKWEKKVLSGESEGLEELPPKAG